MSAATQQQVRIPGRVREVTLARGFAHLSVETDYGVISSRLAVVAANDPRLVEGATVVALVGQSGIAIESR